MEIKKRILSEAAICLRIAAGCFIFAIGFQYINFPNNVVAGGVMGIATIINALSQFPVGVLNILLNIPLFIFAWRRFGLHFIIMSLLAMLLSSLFIDVMAANQMIFTRDPLLASIFGGVLRGLGSGMIYATGASVGGVDIVAKFLRIKHPHINFGTLLMLLDGVVIVTYAIIFRKYDSAMYSVISLFVLTKVVDIVLYGAINVKSCFIITDLSETSSTIKDEITAQLGRGSTIIHGEGAYSRAEKQVILCVIKSNQIVTLRKIVRDIDDKAFMIISDARSVFGKGFESIVSE